LRSEVQFGFALILWVVFRFNATGDSVNYGSERVAANAKPPTVAVISTIA
jgi:hypothetical protein